MKSEQNCHKSYLMSCKKNTEIRDVHEGQKYIMLTAIHWLCHCLTILSLLILPNLHQVDYKCNSLRGGGIQGCPK
jgi:hypothetical protein